MKKTHKSQRQQNPKLPTDIYKGLIISPLYDKIGEIIQYEVYDKNGYVLFKGDYESCKDIINELNK